MHEIERVAVRVISDFQYIHNKKGLLSNHPAGYYECQFSKNIVSWILCRVPSNGLLHV